jgi:hypothetical protein
VSPPVKVNQSWTDPQCMVWSNMQMQPRGELGVDSAVKHTAFISVHGTPLSDTLPGGAVDGTVVAA